MLLSLLSLCEAKNGILFHRPPEKCFWSLIFCKGSYHLERYKIKFIASAKKLLQFYNFLRH